MNNEYIRLDAAIIAIDALINEAVTTQIARALFKAKDTIYNQQRYVVHAPYAKYSKWVPKNDGTHKAYCECCGHEQDPTTWNENYNYCPHCGAEMKGESICY